MNPSRLRNPLRSLLQHLLHKNPSWQKNLLQLLLSQSLNNPNLFKLKQKPLK